jgi:hypothetical protein
MLLHISFNKTEIIVQGNDNQYSEKNTNFNLRNVLLLICSQLCREFPICMQRVAQDAVMRRDVQVVVASRFVLHSSRLATFVTRRRDMFPLLGNCIGCLQQATVNSNLKA